MKSFSKKTFKTLNEEFQTMVKRIEGHHKVESIDKLKKSRRSQIKFLNALVQELENSKDTTIDKASCFTGALFVTCQMIQCEWTTSSHTLTSLKNLIGTPLDKIDNEQKKQLLGDFCEFLNQNIFSDGQSQKGIDKNSSLVKNIDYTQDLFKKASDLHNDAIKSCIDAVVSKYNERLKPDDKMKDKAKGFFNQHASKEDKTEANQSISVESNP